MLPAVLVFIGIICAVRPLVRGLKVRCERREPSMDEGMIRERFLAGVTGGVGRRGEKGASESEEASRRDRSEEEEEETGALGLGMSSSTNGSMFFCARFRAGDGARVSGGGSDFVPERKGVKRPMSLDGEKFANNPPC